MILPVIWANLFATVLFIGIAIAVWRVPLKTITGDAPDRARWRDIRLWATVLIVIQLLIYAIFR